MDHERMKLRWQQQAASEAAPFGYDEFLTRVAARADARRKWHNAGAGFAGALFVLMGVAVAWRAQQMPAGHVVVHSNTAVATVGAVPHAAVPALVSADTYVAVTALEDRLAWFDDELSAARVAAGRGSVASLAQLRELEFERDRLAQSLVQVKYAAELSAAM
jgi:hypothetical protein